MNIKLKIYNKKIHIIRFKIKYINRKNKNNIKYKYKIII
jgi:hypothetical protein